MFKWFINILCNNFERHNEASRTSIFVAMLAIFSRFHRQNCFKNVVNQQ
jgi:hypothetical protein